MNTIEPADPTWLRRAQERQSRLTKPPGSLGRLEELANRVCAMQRTLQPSVEKPSILVFAGDHGVCEEGVNVYPQAVTRQMVANFLAGGAAINALARSAQADLVVIDVGVIGPPQTHPNLVTRRVGDGTKNFCREPAMTSEQANLAIHVGADCAANAISSGSKLLVIGEMGIGNSTVASALCAALTGASPEQVCGRGTGSDDGGLARKCAAVAKAVALHKNSSNLLASLGGFEIAAMSGVCLEAAKRRTPVVIDGFIATAAAVVATRMEPALVDYLIPSHQSAEPGHKVLLESMNLQPLFDLQMRLGEGTGAALAIPIVRAAVEAFRSMATFESAGVADAVA